MNAWADVIPALQALKKEELILCFLSNMTSKILHNGIRNSNLTEFFDLVISTDEKQTYKPSRMAYQGSKGRNLVCTVRRLGYDGSNLVRLPDLLA
jgi:FMN phosphatase YigB (HAD superfamily)